MDYESMRLKCLEMATAQGLKGDEAIRAAEKMMKFAREGSLIEKAYGPGSDRIETPMAAIHREPPFKDYKPE